MLRQLGIYSIAIIIVLIPSTLCWSAGAATLQKGRPSNYTAKISLALGTNRSAPNGKK